MRKGTDNGVPFFSNYCFPYVATWLFGLSSPAWEWTEDVTDGQIGIASAPL